MGAQINVNKETHNTVVINGDVQAADGGTVFLNMNTADSAVTGDSILMEVMVLSI